MLAGGAREKRNEIKQNELSYELLRSQTYEALIRTSDGRMDPFQQEMTDRWHRQKGDASWTVDSTLALPPLVSSPHSNEGMVKASETYAGRFKSVMMTELQLVASK